MKVVRIGDALLQQGIISQAQLDAAIEYQSKFGGRLGDIIAEMHGVDRELILQISEQSPGKGRLGEMLVQTGQISQEQLNQALKFQKRVEEFWAIFCSHCDSLNRINSIGQSPHKIILAGLARNFFRKRKKVTGIDSVPTTRLSLTKILIVIWLLSVIFCHLIR